jgi:hypothetical protein
MSAPRKYLEHIKEVTLMAAIPSPVDGILREGYGHQHFRFFVEAGFFCIESRKTGRVEDVPPSMIKRRRWFTDEELAAIKTKEVQAP